MSSRAQMLSSIRRIAEKAELPFEKVIIVIDMWEGELDAERSKRSSTAEERIVIRDGVAKVLKATPNVSSRDIATKLEVRVNQGTLASITREMKKFKALTQMKN